MQLVAHQQFNAKEKILSEGIDELSIKRIVDKELQRKKSAIQIKVKSFRLK